MTLKRLVFPLAAAAAVALMGCGDDQDPEGAIELWNRIHDLNYRGFARAPGYETRQPSNASHGNAVDIYVNDVVAQALASGGVSEWPQGSLIVKDGFDGSDLDLVAAMEKRSDGWFWVEWDAEGDSSFSGKPDICIDCHSAGSDYVRAFSLP